MMSKIKDLIFTLHGVSAGTWIRLGVLIAAAINAALRIYGIETVDLGNDGFENAATVTVLIASAAAAYWKNNSFTEAAQAADEVLQIIRSRKKN